MTMGDKASSREVDFKDVTEQEALEILEVRLLPCGCSIINHLFTVLALGTNCCHQGTAQLTSFLISSWSAVHQERTDL